MMTDYIFKVGTVRGVPPAASRNRSPKTGLLFPIAVVVAFQTLMLNYHISFWRTLVELAR